MANIKNILLENEYLNQTNLDLEIENKELKAQNDFLQRQVNALKLRCSSLSKENMSLQNENYDMKFTRKYLTSEEAGKKFAQELLGGI